jgi:thiol-disulfide isomerase/thioredoxin
MKSLLISFGLGAALLGSGASVPASALTVRPVTASALKQAIQHYRGHVVLVNFWATWCLPCMKEFGDLVQVSNADKSKGVVVLAVSADQPKDVSSRVIPFLKAHHAMFSQYIIHGDLDTFVNGFAPKWQADFPQTFIFDKNGKLAKEMTGQQSVQTWQKAISPLLGRPRTR